MEWSLLLETLTRLACNSSEMKSLLSWEIRPSSAQREQFYLISRRIWIFDPVSWKTDQSLYADVMEKN